MGRNPIIRLRKPHEVEVCTTVADHEQNDAQVVLLVWCWHRNDIGRCRRQRTGARCGMWFKGALFNYQ